jgi:hypothetical protein
MAPWKLQEDLLSEGQMGKKLRSKGLYIYADAATPPINRFVTENIVKLEVCKGGVGELESWRV